MTTKTEDSLRDLENNDESGGDPFRQTSCQDTVQPTGFISARCNEYGPCPLEMDCPHCQNHIVTHIGKAVGRLPWLVCAGCVVAGPFLFSIPWFLCCVPFCSDSFLDVEHSCPACKRMLGRYRRLSPLSA